MMTEKNALSRMHFGSVAKIRKECKDEFVRLREDDQAKKAKLEEDARKMKLELSDMKSKLSLTRQEARSLCKQRDDACSQRDIVKYELDRVKARNAFLEAELMAKETQLCVQAIELDELNRFIKCLDGDSGKEEVAPSVEEDSAIIGECIIIWMR